MKPKTPKPRVMWANYTTLASHPRCFCTVSDCQGDNEWTEHARVAVRVAVIPLDDVPALVERAAEAMWAALRDGKADDMNSPAIAALTTAGIPCKAKKRRTRK